MQSDDVSKLLVVGELEIKMRCRLSYSIGDNFLPCSPSATSSGAAASLEDWMCEFNRFKIVQLALLKKDTEVLRYGRETTGRCRGCLKGLNYLYNVQNAPVDVR